ncbi:ABC transporter permease [Nocardia sp. NRRL S-836]|uniref:ABC transporter permease n=1 Tax=Nocardia sp. NRRL S-836 TaxID=1519492 RepID=UPI0006AFD84F|nr:ABC transporter permease [Nocardia sp. NRRL S-836]KOV83507.1 ABC transporter permease [Nocardia sp. NRRL S-836]
MLRVVFAGLRARPLRMLLSAIAIALGVAFVSGALVLADATTEGLRAAVAFETRGVDASITSSRGGPDLTGDLLDRVRRVPGVAAAEHRVTVSAPLRDPAGRPVDAAATALAADPSLRPFDLAEGRLPARAGEIAVDRDEVTGHRLGQQITLFGQDGSPHSFTVVGEVNRPSDSGLGSAQLVVLPEDARLLDPGARISEIVAHAAPGTGQQELVAALTRALSTPGLSVVTGQAAAAGLMSQIAPDSAGLQGFFSAFAVLSMVVAAMVITNSFTILLTQRARELAVLRCIGAGRRQVFTSVLAEALALGTVASVAGLFAGLGVAAALQAVTGRRSEIYLPLTGRTAVAALAVGIVITALAATLPALAATRIAPVEALRTPLEGKTARAGRPRVAVAILLLSAGVAAAVVALRAEAEDGAGLAMVAMVALLGAVLAAGPLVAGPVVRALGMIASPLLGMPAKIAALNADRNPKRTAASAAALTIGLAVVSLVTTVTAGLEAGQTKGLAEQLKADFVISSVLIQRPLPRDLADRIAAVPGVAAAAPMQSFSATLGEHGAWGLSAVRGDAVGTLLRPAVLSGRLDHLGPGQLAISEELAEQTGLVVGDTVQAGNAGALVPLRVVAVFDSVQVPGADLRMAVVDLAQMPAIELENSGYDHSVLVGLADRADDTAVRSAVEQVLTTAPLARLSGSADLREQLAEPLRRTLNLLWGLTALAVLIAFAGITNTLSLSVLERVRESALLRALGLTRGGLRSSLAVEAVFVALIGALSGLLLGVGSAWLIAGIVATEGEPMPFTLPWERLGVLFGAALLAAPLAALLPARRAARRSLIAGIAEQ